MDDRTKTFSSVFILAVVMTAAGCGYTQQSRFQMSFLPPAPNPRVRWSDLPPPPAVPPNPYLQQVPAILTAEPAASASKEPRGRALVARAEQAFQRGRRPTRRTIPIARPAGFRRGRGSDAAGRRRESGRSPGIWTRSSTRWWTRSIASTWPDWALRLRWKPDKFEKAPLEDILADDLPGGPQV